MRHWRNYGVCRWVVALVGAAAMLLGSGMVQQARAEFGDVLMNQYSDAAGMRPVVFPHWFHRVRYSCKACHGDLDIKFQAGGNDISMAKIIDGRYCGACHNGNAAPAASGAAPQGAVAAVNSFNRLLKPIAKRNLPPSEDGIHDPAAAGTPLLQTPREAFDPLPKAGSGNNINWVNAVATGKIRPLWNAADHQAKAEVLDLNIVREVKGSMPDVVFPHKGHTELLECTACHPRLFEMQKGASKMSMAAIMLGEGCGTCHGRVAFPVSECRLCHSKVKTPASGMAARGRAPQ